MFDDEDDNGDSDHGNAGSGDNGDNDDDIKGRNDIFCSGLPRRAFCLMMIVMTMMTMTTTTMTQMMVILISRQIRNDTLSYSLPTTSLESPSGLFVDCLLNVPATC